MHQEVESCVARAYAEEIGAMFVETSAKTDTQVQDVFSSHSFWTSSLLDVPAGVGHTGGMKVTQDFSSTFFLRCVPYFSSREGFSHSFPSSTVKSNFVY